MDFLDKLFARRQQRRQFRSSVKDQSSLSVARSVRPDPSPEAKYRKGDFIGQNYEVCSVLGMGGFGVVYQIYSHELKEVFALKTFRDEFLNDEKTRRLFRKEAQLWVDMERHLYLVRAYYVEEMSDRLYIIMEYIAPGEGGLNSLEGYLRSQPPDLIQSLRWAIQFCYGMEYAYSKGLRCHRDIKPSNIMIGTDKTVKISDLGLAGIDEAIRTSAQKKSAAGRDRTSPSEQTILVGGTPTHMSPEQFIDSASCDQRSDIYSFGVVLYEMASGGRLPFFVPPRSASEEEAARWSYLMFRLHAEAPISRLDSKSFPIIRRCLEKQPRKRYQAFRQLRTDLEFLLKRSNGETIKLPALEDLKAWEWGNKGSSLRVLGRFEESLQCYECALRLDSRNAWTWSNKANTLWALKRLDEALKCCDRALELDPKYVNSWIAKGVTLDDLGRHEESIQCYDRGLELDPQNRTLWRNKGLCLDGMRRFDEALRCYDRAIELAPRHAGIWNDRGVVLKRLGHFEEALRCYDRALEFDPSAAMTWENKGKLLIDLRRYEEALPCFDKAIEIDPKNPDARFNKGAALHRLGRLEDAIGLYERVLELSPHYRDVWSNKALAEEKLGRIADAVHSYEQLIFVGDASAQSQINYARKRLSELKEGRNG